MQVHSRRPWQLLLISPQVTSVKVTLFSVAGTKNTIITEIFIIYFLHSQFDINNFFPL